MLDTFNNAYTCLYTISQEYIQLREYSINLITTRLFCKGNTMGFDTVIIYLSKIIASSVAEGIMCCAQYSILMILTTQRVQLEYSSTSSCESCRWLADYIFSIYFWTFSSPCYSIGVTWPLNKSCSHRFTPKLIHRN